MSDGGVEKAGRRRIPTLPSVRSRAERGSSLDRLIGRIDAARGDTVIGAGHRAGALVRTMRVEAGLSQQVLAEALGISQARVSEIEAGDGPHGPSWDLMERIAAACGRDIGLLPSAADSFARTGEIDMEFHYGHVSALVRDEGYAGVLADPGHLFVPDFNLRYQGIPVRIEGGESNPDRERRFSGYGSLGDTGITRSEGRGASRRRGLGKPG